MPKMKHIWKAVENSKVKQCGYANKISTTTLNILKMLPLKQL